MNTFFQTEDIKNHYDLIILGAGPAGCTAGIYAGRDAVDTLILESKFPGGNLSITDTIENYPGFIEPISGSDLATNFAMQAIHYGATIRYGVPVSLKIDNDKKIITLDDGKIITADTIIIATGSTPKQLGVDGESSFIGRGVSFCATCDGGFYKGKKVAVIGGGNSALEEAGYLTKFATEVTLIHRRDEFRASKIEQQRVKNNNKIKLLTSSIITKVIGDKKIEAVMIKDLKTNNEYSYSIDGIFIYVGWNPNTAIFENILELSEDKFIISDESTLTNIPGVFVAGDVRRKLIKQVVTAVADGAIAGKQASNYLTSKQHNAK